MKTSRVRSYGVIRASALLMGLGFARAAAAQVPPTPPIPPVSPTPPTSVRTPYGSEWTRGFDIDRQAIADITRAAVDRSMAALRSMDSYKYSMQATESSFARMRSLSELDEMMARQRTTAWTSGRVSTPPAAWDANDPADSLYREARKALANDANRKAADLFRRIRDQYPKSAYTPDAGYWEAYALQRIGGQDDLRAAQYALTAQLKAFPKATTNGDATALNAKIDIALARRGDASAALTLYGRAVKASSDGCPRAVDDERVDALNALTALDVDKAMPILKKVLARREACTQAMRRTAVWLVASRKTTDAAEILVNVAKNDPDKDVREQAVFWLSNVPTDEAAGMLIDLVKGNGDLDLRKRAVYALSRSKSPRAASTLREVALDVNAPIELRADAVQWYMQGAGRQSDDAMSFLKDVYGRADDAQFKRSILSSIAQQRTEAARDFLMNVAQNQKESFETRRSVLSYVSMAGVLPAQIATLYDKTNELELKKQLLSTMSMLKENGGIDKLLDVARNDKNVELKKQALSSLSRSKDPRVLQLLQEIIDR